MVTTIPFSPTKGEAFRIYFSYEGTWDKGTQAWRTTWKAGNIALGTWKISQDGASAVNLVNSPVAIINSNGYIDLTADEMNANVVVVNGYYYVNDNDTNDSEGYSSSTIIYTSGINPSTESSPAVLNTITQLIDKGYNVSQIAYDESGYNYYLTTSDNNPWWIIIKEKTDFTTIGYAMKHNNVQSSTDGWTNRATLTYSATFPLASIK